MTIFAQSNIVDHQNQIQGYRLALALRDLHNDPHMTPEYKEERAIFLESIYQPIPADATMFLYHYGYMEAQIIHSWSWSDTFSCWSALVTLTNGWYGWTLPRRKPIPIDKEVDEELTRLGFYA